MIYLSLIIHWKHQYQMIKVMNKRSIILAMANPIPEIMPDEALAAGAEVVGTGRSDFPNQINNVLVFPGIFRKWYGSAFGS